MFRRNFFFLLDDPRDQDRFGKKPEEEGGMGGGQ